MFTIGDIDAVESSPTSQPYIAIIQNATGSQAAAYVLTIVTLLLIALGGVNVLTTSSRQLW